jgi:hypothetical protein
MYYTRNGSDTICDVTPTRMVNTNLDHYGVPLLK